MSRPTSEQIEHDVPERPPRYAKALRCKGDGTPDDPMRFIASAPTIDRDEDIIVQAGWELEHYRRNPVFLWCHDYHRAPIGRCVMVEVMPLSRALEGSETSAEDLGIPSDADVLVKDVEFDTEDPEADSIRRKYVQGFLNAVSVGFRVLEWEARDEGPGYRIERAELMETSAVPVPSNRNALQVRGAKSVEAADAKMGAWMVREARALLKSLGASLKATDYPSEGDDQAVHLDNSEYDVPPSDLVTKAREYEEIWGAGGNVEGDNQYERLTPVVDRGGAPETDTEREAIHDREAWAARHAANFRLPGVVAQLKWYVVGSRGVDHQREVIDEAIAALEEDGVERFALAVELMGDVEELSLAGARTLAVRLMPDEEDGDEYKAEPDELEVGDFVRWDSAGGVAQGQIERIERDGTIDVPDADVTVDGEPEDPAALIRIYEEDDGGWEPTEVLVAHRFSALAKIDPLPAPVEDDDDEDGADEMDGEHEEEQERSGECPTINDDEPVLIRLVG